MNNTNDSGGFYHASYAIVTVSVFASCASTGCETFTGAGSRAITLLARKVPNEYDFTGFDVTDAGSSFKIDLRRGDSFAVKVRQLSHQGSARS